MTVVQPDPPSRRHWFVALDGDRVSYVGHAVTHDIAATLAPSNHVEITEAEHDVVMAGGHFRMIDGEIVPADPPEPPIQDAIDAAIRQIDARAEDMRSLVLTRGAGMAAVYQAKEREAAAILAGQTTLAPLLSAEVGFTGATLTDVAHIVMDRATAAYAKAAQIESVRLRAKRAIRSATSAAEVQSVMKSVSWP